MCKDLLEQKGWTTRLIPAEITSRFGRILKYRRCRGIFRDLPTCPWTSNCTPKCPDYLACWGQLSNPDPPSLMIIMSSPVLFVTNRVKKQLPLCCINNIFLLPRGDVTPCGWLVGQGQFLYQNHDRVRKRRQDTVRGSGVLFWGYRQYARPRKSISVIVPTEGVCGVTHTHTHSHQLTNQGAGWGGRLAALTDRLKFTFGPKPVHFRHHHILT